MSIADELDKLANLRDRGVLTEEEFQAQKGALLSGTAVPAGPKALTTGWASAPAAGQPAQAFRSYTARDGKVMSVPVRDTSPGDSAKGLPMDSAKGLPMDLNRRIADAGRRSPNTFSVVGIIFGVIGLFFLPIVFGVMGMVLGAVGKARGEPRGTTAVVLSGIALVGGIIFSLVLWGSLIP